MIHSAHQRSLGCMMCCHSQLLSIYLTRQYAVAAERATGILLYTHLHYLVFFTVGGRGCAHQICCRLHASQPLADISYATTLLIHTTMDQVWHHY